MAELLFHAQPYLYIHTNSLKQTDVERKIRWIPSFPPKWKSGCRKPLRRATLHEGREKKGGKRKERGKGKERGKEKGKGRKGRGKEKKKGPRPLPLCRGRDGTRRKTAATYSPACAVPSARRSLTALFGMGRGGTSAPKPPQ